MSEPTDEEKYPAGSVEAFGAWRPPSPESLWIAVRDTKKALEATDECKAWRLTCDWRGIDHSIISSPQLIAMHATKEYKAWHLADARRTYY